MNQSSFMRIFGFERDQRGDPLVPNDDDLYGFAGYSDWSSDYPDRISWIYEVGNFDYIWGFYGAVSSKCRFAALFVMDKKTKLPVKLIESLTLSPERQTRYGFDGRAHRAIHRDLTVTSEDDQIVPPVDFNER